MVAAATQQSVAAQTVTDNLDFVETNAANSQHGSTELDRIEFDRLHDEGIGTGAPSSQRQPVEASSSAVDAGATEEPLTSQPLPNRPTRFTDFVTSSLGWIWGTFRAYGGVRDEGAKVAEPNQRTRG